MKTTSLEEAKSQAKAQSLDEKYKDVVIYIIYCNRSEYFYVDTDSLITELTQRSLVG